MKNRPVEDLQRRQSSIVEFIKSYRWLLPSLGFSVAMVALRIMYTGHIRFVFLIWNLFLAVVPLFAASRLERAGTKPKGWLLAALWLLFFPNSMYIVTDLFHLHEGQEMPLWFDLLLLLSAALNGVIMGFLSLSIVERWMSGFLSKNALSMTTFLLLLLCGYGIYLGRYERWNSWDVLSQPLPLLSGIFHQVVHPIRNRDIWVLSASFALWMYLLYKLVPRLRSSLRS